MNIYCSRCKRDLPSTNFNKARTNRGFQRWCKECLAEYSKSRRGLINEQQAKRRDAIKGTSDVSKYGMTHQDYADLLREQNYVCAICGNPETETGRNGSLSVDHDHNLGLVRGLLCAKCNRGLGLARDSKELFLKFAVYLASSEKISNPTEKEINYLIQCINSSRRFSTCSKAQYYAIILDREGYQISQGWNGSPSGMTHCDDGGCLRVLERTPVGTEYSNCISSHAEQGAILRCSVKDRMDGTIIVNGPPCLDCTKLIAYSGLHKVIYLRDESYDHIADQRAYLFKLNNILEIEVDHEDLF